MWPLVSYELHHVAMLCRQVSCAACRALCSYTHPALVEAGEGPAGKLPRFASLKELRRHLEERLKLQFCSVCLEGRKAWRQHTVTHYLAL